MDAKACPSGYRLKRRKCVPTERYAKGINKELDLILQKGKINENLRTAIQETKKAIAKDDIELATELTSVKGYIVGELTDKKLGRKPREIQKYRFREDDDFNTKTLGGSVYNKLDNLHHDLAFSQGQLPRGMMVFASPAPDKLTGYSRPSPKGKHPVLRMMEKEHKETMKSVEAVHKKRRK